jgi:predicted regulator of Ras-like GTPase activity (Roadblock/LC7/MglB family)
VQAILAELGALMGVKGSFVCGRDGALLVRAMPDGMNDIGLAAIGRSLMQTLTGLEVDRHKRAGEMGFAYADGMMLVKNLGAGCLCVLCTRQANVAMINMTANMAARKLKESLAAQAAAPVLVGPPSPSVAAPAVASTAASASVAEGPCLPLSVISQIEHELARAVGPVAMLAVDDAVAAMGFARQTLPVASTLVWLERLGAEIADGRKRTHFLQTARQIVQSG